jgi:diaminohydroxyphosphoribosylaminopyrimidine deaminase/5-amino-6-(5-phosphoribosylamino)uracil reductase
VDRILAYLAPMLLGGPITALDDAGVSTISQARRWRFDGVETVGADVRLSLVPS